jgi:FtsP/CotA-like multicopper oxidase with cupredoxin domain
LFTRRDMIRMGLVGAGYAILPSDRRWSPVSSAFGDDNDAPTSPATTPFVRPLPVPPQAQEVPSIFDADNPPTAECAQFVSPATRYYRVVAEERSVSFDPKIPDTQIWGYRDATVPEGSWPYAVGPTLGGLFGFNQVGNGMFVQHVNNLPRYHKGFGVPITTVHFHGGHHLSSADGFPTNIEGFPDFLTMPGGHYDHCYPLLDPGFLDSNQNGGAQTLLDVSERPSTLWYHDHLLDFTGPNVYRGLAAVAVMQDELDSGDEEDPNPEALRLPGYPDFDIPLVIQDKRFNRDGSLWFDTFDHDGFLGDKFLVNGAVQPYFEVERRKYRFRFLNASNARIYQFFLSDKLGYSYPMTEIATEGGLLSRPLTIKSFQIGMAERIEVVVDFAAPEFANMQELYFENRLRQTEGRKPDDVQSRGTQMLQFRLRPPVPDNDPSRVGKLDGDELVLRRFEATSADVLAQAYANLKTFRFDRSGGGWTINGRPAGDLETARRRSPVDEPEIWRLVNDSGGWWHPVHIHSEFGRIILRNGRTPPLREQDGIAKKDTYLLRDNESVDVFLQFRDFKGPFTFHCHNLEHEDMAMMARFDVV